MQKDSLEETFPEDLTYNSLIEQVIIVSLAPNTRIKSDSHQLKWITSLLIINQRQYELEIQARAPQQDGQHNKYVEIGNSLFLKLHFCQKNQKPITKLKTAIKTNNNQDNLLPYPNDFTFEEYIHFERADRTEGKIIIEDVEMVEITGDKDLEIPEESSYEVIRLPTACQTVLEENSSNEQLMEKTRYLLIKTLDLEDHDTISQLFQPVVTFRHLFKGSKVFIDYDIFHDFCFPEGVPLLKEILGSGYQIVNFILTQEDNSRLYVNCLKFKEKLTKDIIETLPSNCVDKHLHERSLLFAEEAFCIVSKYCYTDFFHTLLEEVFRKYLTLHNAQAYRSRNQIKSEGCIADEEVSFMRLALQFVENYERGLAQAERSLNEIEYMKDSIKIEMEWFEQHFTFPEPIQDAANLFSPRAVHCLFSVLSVQKIVEVFLSMLLEKKIFFVSDSQIVIGYVIESLLSFLYPLKWQHVILPILPEKLLQLLDAPVPLIAGIPTNLATDDLICSSKDTTIVFLDCNEVISRDKSLVIKDVNHLKEVVKRLRQYQIYSKDHVCQMLNLKQQFFLFRVYEKENENIFSAQHIKHIFFEAMLLFLQNYNSFYTKRQQKSGGKQSLNIQQPRRQFNYTKDYTVQGFISSHHHSLHPFLKKFTECTHFINFIYKYCDSSKNTHKKFIDYALNNQKLNKSPVKLPHYRLSQQPVKNRADIENLKKKSSLQFNHNTTWSPPPKKSQEISTAYSRNNDRFSMRVEDVQFDKERSVIKEEQNKTKTKGGQICEAITRAMTNASFTKRSVIFWTQARVARLKRIFGSKPQKQEKEAEEQREREVQSAKEEKVESPQRKQSKQH